MIDGGDGQVMIDPGQASSEASRLERKNRDGRLRSRHPGVPLLASCAELHAAFDRTNNTQVEVAADDAI